MLRYVHSLCTTLGHVPDTSRKKMTVAHADSKNELDVEVEEDLAPGLRGALAIANTLCGNLLYRLATRLPSRHRNILVEVPRHPLPLVSAIRA